MRAPEPTATMTMTEPTPMMMPSIVSALLSALEAMARNAVPTLSSSAVMPMPRLLWRASGPPATAAHPRPLCRRGTRYGGGRAGDIGLVRDEHDGDALAVEGAEQPHDLIRGFSIERPRRLVCQQQPRIVDERARDRHALLLAAGELLRAMLQAVARSDLLEPHTGRRFGIVRPGSGVGERQHHLAQGRRARQQIELLEHEADGPIPQLASASPDSLPTFAAGNMQFASGWHIQRANQVHHGRLAGAGRPHDGDELAFANIEGDIVEGVHRLLAEHICLVHAAHGNERRRADHACGRASSIPRRPRSFLARLA